MTEFPRLQHFSMS